MIDLYPSRPSWWLPTRYSDNEPRKPGGKGGGQWVKAPGGGVSAPVTVGTTPAEVTAGFKDTQSKYQVHGVYTPERAQLHRTIVDHFMADKPTQPPGKRVAMFMAGGPATGKSSVIKSPTSGVHEPDGAVMVDPDAIKLHLPEYKVLLAAGDKRARQFSHQESSDIAKALVHESQRQGKSLFIDGQGNSGPGHFTSKLQAMHDKGYKVQVTYVTVPVEKALELARGRALKHGRLVDEAAIAKYHAAAARRYPEVEALANSGVLDDLHVYDNRQPKGQEPVLLAHLENGKVVYDMPELMQEFKDKAKAG